MNLVGKAVVGALGGTMIGTVDNISGSSFRSVVAGNISDPAIASGWNVGSGVKILAKSVEMI